MPRRRSQSTVRALVLGVVGVGLGLALLVGLSLAAGHGQVKLSNLGDHGFPEERYDAPAGDPGLFGPDSVTWRVHADASMFVGGIAALLLQSLHPRAAAIVASSSRFREEPLHRLSRTASFVAATTYGPTD